MLKKSYSKTKPVCKVTFTLPVEAANGAKDVRVLGDFNNWSWENGYKMKAGKKDFTAAVELAAGKHYEFRYLIDNHIWENDWKADAYKDSGIYGIKNSVVALEAAAAKKAPAKKTTAKKTTATKTAGKQAPTAKAKPKAAPAAKKAKADDLKKIEGIGPKIAGLLKEDGIVTFADLGKAKITTLKAILEKAGKRYQMHDPSTWAEQAKLANKGEWTKLAKLQDELKGGKRA
ncbi:MAG: glycoside hydrolase family 13 [Bacteroidota bacterium]